MTDYPSLPTYPRFFGKVESLQFHRREEGVRGSAHNLIKSYLGSRFQKVKLNNATSHLESVKVGVLRRTILGPLLTLCQRPAT